MHSLLRTPPPLLISSLLCCVISAHAAAPVLRQVKGAQSATPLLYNGSFEQTAGGSFQNWSSAPNGLSVAPGEGRSATQALRCENQSGGQWFGASQSLTLNRTNIAPLVVRGWSKAKEVSGSPDSGYSLYVDLLYEDGTPLWGQTANFHTGTHDWEQREIVILPDKPVKTVTVYCLLRGHSGTAWFDDISLEEITAKGEALLFQGVPVLPTGKLPKPTGKTRAFATRDELALSFRGNTVTSLKVAGRELCCPAPSGFLARDVATGSDVYAFEDGACPDLGLRLESTCRAENDRIVVQGRISDTTGKDRAITLLFALPVNALGWEWGDDIRRHRPIEGKREFANQVVVNSGSTRTMSQYPLAAIYSEHAGLALALDMGQPAQYRLVYHPGTKQFYIAYDFGLVPETQRFPSSADFRFVLYRFDPRWGFRAAFQKYTEIFADDFRVLSQDQGIWMPFTDVSTVQDWQDFGFKYHEGNNNVTWDDAHDVLSFRYTEPMTWWMRMSKGTPRTTSEAIRSRDELAKGANEHQRRMAQVAQLAGMYDESGQPSLLFRNEPWCDGAVWSLNPNPELPPTPSGSAATERDAVNGATVYWNDAIKQSLYGPNAKGHLDGEYLDSLEGYVTAELNFRREHFRYTTVPLTFSSDTKQPALSKGLAVYEFTKWISQDVHRLGKLMFANSVPYRFTFLCPWLDVMGTETDWLQQGRYAPASDAQMNLWRTMSGRKPYLLLMNTDYSGFTPDMVEKYFQRSLFYGIFPSMFSHNAAENPYWGNPKWYNRDRPLFRKYLPLIKRIAEAGWQPVTSATSDNPRVFVERFGPDQSGTVFLTLLNDTTSPQEAVLRLDKEALPKTDPQKARQLISGAPLDGISTHEFTLQPQQVELIELNP